VQPTALGTIGSVVLSEIWRDIGLLTSVGTFARNPRAMAVLANLRRRRHSSGGQATEKVDTESPKLRAFLIATGRPLEDKS
jgi:hypothetical protein